MTPESSGRFVSAVTVPYLGFHARVHIDRRTENSRFPLERAVASQAGSPHRSAREPPGFDVVVGREGPRVDAAQIARRNEQHRPSETEVVRLLVVQKPVQGGVALLARRLAAVAR